MDMIFIYHEIEELKYREMGYSYDVAHEKAQEKYNYKKEIDKVRYGNIKKD